MGGESFGNLNGGEVNSKFVLIFIDRRLLAWKTILEEVPCSRGTNASRRGLRTASSCGFRRKFHIHNRLRASWITRRVGVFCTVAGCQHNLVAGAVPTSEPSRAKPYPVRLTDIHQVAGATN